MTIVWDETTNKTYETGVDHAILFPMDGPGVPWNGLTGVSVDVSGGESEELYYNGVKYLDVVDAEAFQATISAMSAPREFAACEGVVKDATVPGMYIPFGRRAKFNMSWRTRIGNEIEATDYAYKLHIVYNATVMPSPRNFQTLSETPSPDVRSLQIKATPACGPFSYFIFDSRDADLSALEAQLLSGVLPLCSNLGTYVTTGSPDDSDCQSLLEDLESYVYGEAVSDDKIVGLSETKIHGTINPGLDQVVLAADGAFTVNDSAATETGTHPVLSDDDDTSYIESASGDLGYTIGLPSLAGYVSGSRFELHIRLSVSGDVNTDDPDSIVDADAQVFITTDATGDLDVGGFSDGTDDGVGFSIPYVDGSINDYVVPLDISAWPDNTIDDVVAALNAGAYLNVVSISNNNPDTTPIVRVYEASVAMLDDTDSSKSLRSTPGESEAWIEQYIPSAASIDTAANTVSIDFKAKQVSMDTYGLSTNSQPICAWGNLATQPGWLNVELDGSNNPVLNWYDEDGTTLLDTLPLDNDVWYTAYVYWTWGTVTITLVETDTPTTSLANWTHTVDVDPKTYCSHYAGMVINSEVTYEVSIDNAKMQVHCHEVSPPAPYTVDVPATQGRLVRDAPSTGYHTDNVIPLTSSTTIDFYAYFGGAAGDTSNYLYMLQFNGIAASSTDWIPVADDGYELTDVRPYIIGYIAGGPQITEEATGWTPPAEKAPFVGVSSSLLSFDTFSGSYSADNPKQIAGGNYPVAWAGIGGAYADPIHLVAGSGGIIHIIVQGYGFRFTFSPV